MKFEDIEVGMKVQDHVGNEYTVSKLAYNYENGYAIRLRCTKHVNAVRADYMATFAQEGDAWWILSSRTKLLRLEDPTVQHLLKVMGYPTDIKSHLHINITADDTKYDFWVYPSIKLETFDLTGDELTPIIEPPTLRVSDLRVGMKLVDSAGEGFVLVGYDDKWVHLAAMLPLHPIGSCDTCYPALIRVPLEDKALAGFTPAED